MSLGIAMLKIERGIFLKVDGAGTCAGAHATGTA